MRPAPNSCQLYYFKENVGWLEREAREGRERLVDRSTIDTAVGVAEEKRAVVDRDNFLVSPRLLLQECNTESLLTEHVPQTSYPAPSW